MSRWRRLTPYCAVLVAALGLAVVPEAPAIVPPPEAPPPTAFSFAAGGDMGYNPMAAGTIKGIASAGVDFALHLGDMAYDQIYPESAWCDFIKNPRDGVGPDFAYQIVTGGHDLGKGPGPAAQYRTLIDRYVTCLPDRMGSTGTYGKEYFFDHPKVARLMRVIMISPSITMPDGVQYDYSPGTVHHQWLVDAIDGARSAGIRWIAVGMARNCISTGEKGCEIGLDLFNMLVNKRVDLILQGHEHGYARSRQLSTGPSCPAIPVNKVVASCFADDGATDNYVKGAGPVVVIAGTLGIGLRPMNPADSEAGAFRAIMGSNIERTHGFMKFTVTTERIQAQFVATDKGSFGDEFTVVDPNPGAPAPLATFEPPTSATTAPPVAIALMAAAGPARPGYWMLGSDGAVYPFGEAAGFDSPVVAAGRAAVDVEPSPTGLGYRVLDDSGAVVPFGDATGYGGVPTGVLRPGEVPSSLAATSTGQGYWVFTNRGRALAFGDARFLGDVSETALNGPVLDSVATPTGQGYYMVASDGGIFAFDAPFKGSMGGRPLAKPVTGMVRYGDGYLMVGEDGGIFSFSDLPFAGSLGAKPPAHPIVAVAALT